MNLHTALITGASRGIGRAAAAALAKEGFRLVLNCRHNKDLLHALCSELTDTCHVQCIPVVGDVGDAAFCASMFETAQTKADGIDVLINNAGISRIGLLDELSCEDWDRLIQTNLSSVFYCSKLAIPHMLHQKRGKIINISSVWGDVGASCEVAYSATKGGVNAFTKALAKELAPSNIQVNAIACGAIDTEMNGHLSLEELQQLAEEIPAGRLGRPEEAAAAILQLIHAPSYLTGQIIGLNGGWN